MKKYANIIVLALMLSACSSVDTLSLYRDMTQAKSQLDVQTGQPTQFSGSEKICITATCAQGDHSCAATDHYNASPLMSGSDYTKYYDLTTGADGYARYGSDSQYVKDVAVLTGHLDRLMESFQKTGLKDELKKQGKTPALMFDIDNTLEFSAGPDSDSKGDGPVIQGMVDFVDRWCFKDGLACYFVTARPCNAANASPTQKWLKANLRLDDDKVKRYTHFSSNAKNLSCSVQGNPNIAYKDVIREALERQENVFWLMSIGDQLTDSLGEHSGMKIRVPNQFFHSDIAPNQYAPWGVGQCGRPVTIAPPRSCAESLLDHAIQVTALDYCSNQPN